MSYEVILIYSNVTLQFVIYTIVHCLSGIFWKDKSSHKVLYVLLINSYMVYS